VVAIPEDKVFTAAALFDLAFLRMGHADAKTKLPELSCAVINVMRKIDDASYDTRGTDLVQRTCVFAKQLRSKGDANTNIDIAMEDIVKAERALLSALQWQIDIPSLQQWLQLLVNRFAVLCPWTTQRLKWVHSVTFQYGKCIVLKQVTYKQVCPHRLHTACFAQALCWQGLCLLSLFAQLAWTKCCGRLDGGIVKCGQECKHEVLHILFQQMWPHACWNW